jgi:TonB family protein
MALSKTAAQQREQEIHALKRFLAYSLIGSLGLHGVALLFKINPPQSAKEPAPEEITIIVSEPIESPVVEDSQVPEVTELSEDSAPSAPPPASLETATTLLEEPIAPPAPTEPVTDSPVQEETLLESVVPEEVPATPTPENRPAIDRPQTTEPRQSMQDFLQQLRRNRQQSSETATDSDDRPADSIAPSTAPDSNGTDATATAPSPPGNGGTGEGVSASCRSCPTIDYPDSALSAGAEGRVRVVAETDEQGRVIGVTLTESSGNAELDQAVLEQVRQEYEFNGVSAGSAIPIEIDMTIEGSDYNREVQQRGERTEVELPSSAPTEVVEESPPQTAAEPETETESLDPGTLVDPPTPLSSPDTDPEPSHLPSPDPTAETEAEPELPTTAPSEAPLSSPEPSNAADELLIEDVPAEEAPAEDVLVEPSVDFFDSPPELSPELPQAPLEPEPAPEPIAEPSLEIPEPIDQPIFPSENESLD